MSDGSSCHLAVHETSIPGRGSFAPCPVSPRGSLLLHATMVADRRDSTEKGARFNLMKQPNEVARLRLRESR